LLPPPPSSTLFPYTTLFRSLRQVVSELRNLDRLVGERHRHISFLRTIPKALDARDALALASQFQVEARSLQLFLSNIVGAEVTRSEEHTSELQSRSDLVCRL